MKKLVTISVADPALSRVQDNIGKAIGPLLAHPLLDGILLERVALAGGANAVPHGLGRKVAGWILTRRRASATVHDTQDSNPIPEKTLQLVASSAVVVDVYVF